MTASMSQPYYELDVMIAEISQAKCRDYNDAYNEGRKNAFEEMGIADPEKVG